ncbi:MAG: histone deacetylase [Bacteroidetes bacterium]|nr:histone deacetylase [Bacteroidota bacterium]MDA0904003.1 histone deacetylase [Bacteroidota bacterium]MDA1243007.1 histone deacetylase [Bacteroidota bacterium]
MKKYELLQGALIHRGLAQPADFFEPSIMEERDILRAHDADYWRRTLEGLWSKQEVRRSGFPWSHDMVQRERIIMQGTLECSRKALASGRVALNIAGGTHHAYADRAEGFCILNDFSIAALALLDEQRIQRAVVIDLDVHQGNGTAHMLRHEPRVLTFSMHGERNYPMHKECSDVDVALPDDTSDDMYLSTLSYHLDALLSPANQVPDMVFYQCGVDILASDALGRLAVSMAGCRERDRMVFEACSTLGIPVVCAMGGGYSPDVNTVVQAHLNTFQEALDAWH